MIEPDFSERVVIVTGAGKGIGRACALAFARMGAKVVMSGRSRDPLEETQELILDLGAKSAVYVGDVADQSTAEGAVVLALSEFGRLDFAVNNAGVSPWVGTTAECSIESWQQVISINLTGTWLGMKFQIPALLDHGGGAIVNMSSVAALSTFPGYCPYSASKWGIVGITRVAAREYAGSNIRVNAVAPGAIDTPLFADVVGSTPNTREDYEAAAPMKRIARPEEVASAATWLCSEGASYVTGVLVPVEGGSTL
ncbi:MAG TPA: SDR family NAD(P)-dependent oxidoreductase [Solirubrobacteraceae bacterium]|jgi:NAD(P)-dependent dehydrogenase (short-subunit alcohol dehydrogenase family)